MKDAPTVAANAPGVRVAVLKGKQNYFCRNRAHSVSGDAQLSFDDGSDVPKGVADQMRRILRWSNETETGDRDELPFEVDQRAWRQLSVTPQECLAPGRTVPRGRTASPNWRRTAPRSPRSSSSTPTSTRRTWRRVRRSCRRTSSSSSTRPTRSSTSSPRCSARHSTPRDCAPWPAWLGRCSAPSSWSAAVELVAVADRFATSLQIQYDRNELTGLDEDCRARVEPRQ